MCRTSRPFAQVPTAAQVIKSARSREQFLFVKAQPSVSLTFPQDCHAATCYVFGNIMSNPTRPILGHLTESWTPPASCFSVQVPGARASPWTAAFLGRTCRGYYYGVFDDANCWPPTTANAPEHLNTAFFSGWGFYSPGTLCPSGFTKACTATFDQPVTGWKLQFPLAPGETAAGCCPRYRLF